MAQTASAGAAKLRLALTQFRRLCQPVRAEDEGGDVALPAPSGLCPPGAASPRSDAVSARPGPAGRRLVAIREDARGLYVRGTPSKARRAPARSWRRCGPARRRPLDRLSHPKAVRDARSGRAASMKSTCGKFLSSHLPCCPGALRAVKAVCSPPGPCARLRPTRSILQFRRCLRSDRCGKAPSAMLCGSPGHRQTAHSWARREARVGAGGLRIAL